MSPARAYLAQGRLGDRLADLSAELDRLRALFAAAGAEVIYAPYVDEAGARTLAALGVPVNVLAAGAMRDLTAAQIGALGAARISIGGGLARVVQ